MWLTAGRFCPLQVSITGIRVTIAKICSPKAAEEITIRYGGSMNDKNAAELLVKKNVNGGSIGGASLVPEKFTAIVDAANA